MHELQERSAAYSEAAMEAAPASAAADGPRAGAEPAPDGRSGRNARRGFSLASVLLSLAFHGGVLAAGLAWAKSETGTVEDLTGAISVELAVSSVLEAAHDSPIPDTAASEAAAAERDGNSEALESVQSVPLSEIEARPPPPAEVVVVVVEPKAIAVPPPEGLEVIEGAHDGGEAAGYLLGDKEVREPPKANQETPREDAKPERETAKQPTPERPQREAKDKQQKAALQQGGVTARARSGSVASSGRVSASTGDMLGYKARVNARVAGNKPSSGGGRGTATVSFGVSGSGGLAYARLKSSSGSAALDSAAVAAVRRAAPFPPTPTGGSLSFSFSFYFR